MKEWLAKNSFFENILYAKKIDSTNEWAKRYFFSNKSCNVNTLFLADKQTAGKGRFSRSWLCAANKQINMSILIYPKIINSNYLQLMCLCAALAVYYTIESLTNLQCEVKWPNDILINNRKVCGILCETLFYNNNLKAIIVGIGINVYNNRFNKSISKKATSIFLESKKFISKNALIICLLENFNFYYKKFNLAQFDDIIYEYRSVCTTLNKKIQFKRANKIINAVAIDITPLGELVVKTSSGEIIILNHEEIFYNSIYNKEV